MVVEGPGVGPLGSQSHVKLPKKQAEAGAHVWIWMGPARAKPQLSGERRACVFHRNLENFRSASCSLSHCVPLSTPHTDIPRVCGCGPWRCQSDRGGNGDQEPTIV